MSIVIFIFVIIGLSLLILGHEAGHFFAAKKLGMKVDEFGFGFPPRIFKKRYGETDYSFNWLPFGGFVRIAGESDPALSGDSAVIPSASEGISGIATPRPDGARPVQQQVVYGARNDNGEEKNKLFFLQPAWKRAIVIAAGVTINFFLGWILISAVLMMGTPNAILISGVQAGSPAEDAGLVSGDILKGFEGAASFVAFVEENRGEEIQFKILRDGEEINFSAVPRVDAPPGEGALGIFLADVGSEKMGFFAAIGEGFSSSLFIAAATFTALYQLVVNLFLHGSLLEGVVGPVGIFGVAQSAGGIGMAYLVQVIAIISLNLFVVNLIPFPALDGGRLFLILVEKIKGSPVPKMVEAWANGLGFAFLLTLMALLTVRDIGGLL